MSLHSALVIDDDETDRNTVRMHLEDAGIEVTAPSMQYATVEDLVKYAADVNADVTVCDHRLQPRGMAPFFGAEAVDKLVANSRVAVLMTSYFDTDFHTSIRLHKRNIPNWLEREQLQETDALEELMATVQNEINGILAPERKLWPTAIRVGDVVGEADGLVFDVFIDGWRPEQAVRVPAASVPPQVASEGHDLVGKVLLAEVNTGALASEQVYFGKISGPVDPAEWNPTETGAGAAFPARPAGRGQRATRS